MNPLAWKDIRFNPLRFLLAAAGVGFLLMGSMGIVGIYRGIVDDAMKTIDSIGADLWVVQGGRQGPFAEGSVVSSDMDRRVEGVAGVHNVRRFVQNNLQFTIAGRQMRIAVTGLDFPKDRGEWLTMAAGRYLQAARQEAIADASLGMALGQVVRLGRNDFTIVGITRGQVDSSGDGLLFVTVPDALDIANARPSESVLLDRADGLGPMADTPSRIAAVVLSVASGTDIQDVIQTISSWGDANVLTAQDERDVLINGRLWRLRLQILFFASLLLGVTGVVIAMTIYSSTMEKLHQIAMLKLIGARDSFILSMILQQALLVGLAAYAVGLGLANVLFPLFPRRVALQPWDLGMIFAGLMAICVAGSWFGISRALRVGAKEVLS